MWRVVLMGGVRAGLITGRHCGYDGCMTKTPAFESCSFLPSDTTTPHQQPVLSTFHEPADSLRDTAVLFSHLTTLRTGGPAKEVIAVDNEEDFVEALKTVDAESNCDPHQLLVLGGGSNLVVSDEGFDGTVVVDRRDTFSVREASGCGGVTIDVPAGMPWDAFVAEAVSHDWMGVEALSGIPGTVGAAPVQNIGAYGQEVAETIATVKVWDRLHQRSRMYAVGEMMFGYRTSRIKQSLTDPELAKLPEGITWGPTGRWVVLGVQFQMRPASLSRPVAYRQLADMLGVEMGARAPQVDVRQAVLELRRSKGMVLDPEDHDTWSAGSFFTNPIISTQEADQLPHEAPRYPVTDHTKINNIGSQAPVVEGVVKTSAAWLIDHAGFSKGFAVSDDAPARLSTKHVLALTNRGDATADDIVQLARHVRDGVRDAFGITLVPEPVFLGMSLDD